MDLRRVNTDVGWVGFHPLVFLCLFYILLLKIEASLKTPLLYTIFSAEFSPEESSGP
jgi:hypothetical protein